MKHLLKKKPYFEYLFVALVLFFAGFFLKDHINYNYIDFAEGDYYYIAWRLFHGEHLYTSIFTPHPPVLFLFGSFLMRISTSVLFFRCFHLLIYLACYVLMYGLLRRFIKSPMVRMLGSLLYFILPHSGYWWETFTAETYMRPLILGVLYLGVAKRKTGVHYIGIVLLLYFLSFLKYSSIVVSIVVCVCLILESKKKGLLATAFLIVGCLATGFFLSYMTHGQFLYQTVIARQNIPFKPYIAQRSLVSHAFLSYIGFFVLTIHQAVVTIRKKNMRNAVLFLVPLFYFGNGVLLFFEGTYEYIFYSVECLFIIGFLLYLEQSILFKKKTVRMSWLLSIFFFFSIISIVFFLQTQPLFRAYATNSGDLSQEKEVFAYIVRNSKPDDEILTPPYLAFVTKRKIIGNYSDAFFGFIEYAYNKKDKERIDAYYRQLIKSMKQKKPAVVIFDKRFELISPIDNTVKAFYKKGRVFEATTDQLTVWIRK